MARASSKHSASALTPEQIEELSETLISFRHDPYGFVMFAFPWGEAGTPLENETGPDRWQYESMHEVGAALADIGKVQQATASGKGVGKSTMGAWMTLWALYTEVDTKGRVTANTESQMRTTTWPEVAKWYNLMMPALRDMFILTATSLYSTAPGKEKTWRCDAVTWSKNNVEAFAGLHNKGRRIYVLFDEASAIADPVWDTTDGIMSDANTEVIWLALGNPTQATGRFRQCWGKLRAQWIRRKVDSRTVKITDKKKLAEQIEAYGEDSDYVRKYILGEFPNSANSQFYGGALIEAAMARDPVAYIYEPLLMGVDVARFGDDSTVISFRRGRDACSIPWVKLRGWSVVDVAAKVAELKREHFVDMIFVDGGGVGGGVVDILRKAGHDLFEVNSAGKPDSGIKLTRPIKLKNKRSEMHAIFREWLDHGALPDDTELEDEMASIEYYYDPDDRLLLERKEDMKSRGLGSPDCVDSIALTFAFPVADKIRTEIQNQLSPRSAQPQEEYNPYG